MFTTFNSVDVDTKFHRRRAIKNRQFCLLRNLSLADEAILVRDLCDVLSRLKASEFGCQRHLVEVRQRKDSSGNPPPIRRATPDGIAEWRLCLPPSIHRPLPTRKAVAIDLVGHSSPHPRASRPTSRHVHEACRDSYANNLRSLRLVVKPISDGQEMSRRVRR